jgi:hypothetical protein
MIHILPTLPSPALHVRVRYVCTSKEDMVSNSTRRVTNVTEGRRIAEHTHMRGSSPSIPAEVWHRARMIVSYRELSLIGNSAERSYYGEGFPVTKSVPQKATMTRMTDINVSSDEVLTGILTKSFTGL